MSTTPSLTVALSGGGVAGLGHIPVLAALDELGVVPDAISGASMGAVIATCYASGMSAEAIEDHTLSITASPLSHTWKFFSSGWRDLMSATIPPEKVIDTIAPYNLPATLGEMAIPVTVVATDFNRREPVYFTTENTRKSLAASIAIPGVFSPFKWHNKLLIDGGVINNLPVDALPPSDYTLAVDVASEPPCTDASLTPGTFHNVTSSVRMMVSALSAEKLKARQNVILVQPDSRSLGPLELNKIEEAIRLSKPEKDKVKKRLEQLMK